jgi:hypothetical protein
MSATNEMCGLLRIHAWRGKDFKLLDVSKNDASKVMKELRADGWQLVYTEVL